MNRLTVLLAVIFLNQLVNCQDIEDRSKQWDFRGKLSGAVEEAIIPASL